jgi:hypothetical protein
MKECNKCKEMLPLDNFVKSRINKDGKYNTCRACTKKQRLEFKLNEPEKFQAKHTQQLANNKLYRLKNLDYFKDYQKQYREKNKEKMKTYQKEYRRKWLEDNE